MADTDSSKVTRRLGQHIRELLSKEVTNGYSALTVRMSNNGVATIKVKDSREAKTLTITIAQDAE